MPGYGAMSHAAVRMPGRGSFGSAYASALMMTNPTMNNRRNQLIDWLSDCLSTRRNGSRQRNCRKSSPSSAGEASQPSINEHTNKYQCARQSLTKAKPLKKTVQNVISNILLRRNINNIIAGNRNLKRQDPYPTVNVILLGRLYRTYIW